MNTSPPKTCLEIFNTNAVQLLISSIHKNIHKLKA